MHQRTVSSINFVPWLYIKERMEVVTTWHMYVALMISGGSATIELNHALLWTQLRYSDNKRTYFFMSFSMYNEINSSQLCILMQDEWSVCVCLCMFRL